MGLNLANVFESAGYRCIIQIQNPLTFNNQYQAPVVSRAKEENPWKMLPVSREWHIFKNI